MLAAVTPDSDRYEGLRDYIVGNKRAPPQVPGANVRPRLPNQPGQFIPGIDGKIKVSSQRPGKRTNDTIVYGRMTFTDFQCSRVPPSDIFPGDLVMLHKTKKALGHDTNRATKIASWRQILSFMQSGATETLLTANRVDEILKVRIDEIDAINDQGQRIGEDLDFAQQRRHALNLDLLDTVNALFQEFTELNNETTLLQTNDPTAVFLPHYDWAAVPFLSDWTPDGILVSRDDDEHNSSYFESGGGESGIMMNVAVQGPASTRNCTHSRVDSTPLEFVQLFDAEPRVRDNLYLCLLCEEKLDGVGNFEAYAFTLKPTSSRILEELSKPYYAANVDTPYPNKHGMTHDELSRLVFAWRIGSIMDNRETTLAEPRVRINVAILPVNVFTMARRYGLFVGANMAAGRPIFPGGGAGGGAGGGVGGAPVPNPDDVRAEQEARERAEEAARAGVGDGTAAFPADGINDAWTREQVWSLWSKLIASKLQADPGMSDDEKRRIKTSSRDFNLLLRRDLEFKKSFGFYYEGVGLYGEETAKGKANRIHFVNLMAEIGRRIRTVGGESASANITFAVLLDVLAGVDGNKLAGNVPKIGDIEAKLRSLLPHIRAVMHTNRVQRTRAAF